MKGVIIAGGKGKRLQPLTKRVPKPMVPILEKPVMEYSIQLLKKYGIKDIAITVHYLSNIIRDYFGDGEELGVHLHYFEETEPLGTAGSIKNAEEFLDETFIVLSGDVMTDFNLTEGIKYHVQKQSLLTIFMTKVSNPLGYGVMDTNPNGKVIQFLEKPCLEDVFSKNVNTGIYVIEPEIFKYIQKGEKNDFSLDLFPKLLQRNGAIYGFHSEGYWSDVGNINNYKQTETDVLAGKMKFF